MSGAVVREGDPVFHGSDQVGRVELGASGLSVEGRPAAREGDRITCSEHGSGSIADGIGAVLVGGARLAVDNARTTCGATIRATATRTRIGD